MQWRGLIDAARCIRFACQSSDEPHIGSSLAPPDAREWGAGSLREKADEEFEEIGDSVRDGLAEVRGMGRNLRPLNLERLGMSGTLEEMGEELDEGGEMEIK